MRTIVYRNGNLRRATNLFSLLLFLLPLDLFSQGNAVKQHTTVDWQLDATTGGVQFYHVIKICNDKKVVFLKFNNTNNYQVQVSWKETFTTQEGPQIEGYSGQKTLLLGSGEIKETDCNNPYHKQLVILPDQVKPTYVADVSKFNYKEITVTKSK